MGVDLRAFEILQRLDNAGKLNESRILTLGRQRIDYLHPIASGYTWLDELLSTEFNAVVDSIDVSDYEGASIVHDLQLPVDDLSLEPYDLILDFGTTEHIFDIAQVYGNVDKLLAPGGIYVGVNGRTGWNSHGLFQFTPEFSFTLANKLGFSLESWTVPYSEIPTTWFLYESYGHDPHVVWKTLTRMSYLVMILRKPAVIAGEQLAKSVRYDDYLHASGEEAPDASVRVFNSSQFVAKSL